MDVLVIGIAPGDWASGHSSGEVHFCAPGAQPRERPWDLIVAPVEADRDFPGVALDRAAPHLRRGGRVLLLTAHDAPAPPPAHPSLSPSEASETFAGLWFQERSGAGSVDLVGLRRTLSTLRGLPDRLEALLTGLDDPEARTIVGLKEALWALANREQAAWRGYLEEALARPGTARSALPTSGARRRSLAELLDRVRHYRGLSEELFTVLEDLAGRDAAAAVEGHRVVRQWEAEEAATLRLLQRDLPETPPRSRDLPGPLA